MSAQARGDGPASESEEVPQTGAVRIGADGGVEHYDGTAWRPYGELPDDGDLSGTRFRTDDGDGVTRS
ncbi:hypothetical protein [Streptomyces sp. NPDC002324]